MVEIKELLEYIMTSLIIGYRAILMFSKTKNKKTILIILLGKLHDNTIEELINSFAK